MGFGTDTNYAQLKRDARAKALAWQRAEEAEAKLAFVQRLIDRNPLAVPSNYLRLALGPRDRCQYCLSAYTDCPVHS